MSNGILPIVLKTATFLSMLAVCAVFFLMLMRLRTKTGDVGEKARREIDKAIKRRGEMSLYKTRLSKNGVMYRAGDYNLNPSWYILARLAIGVLFAVLSYLLLENLPFSFLAVPLGYFATEWYFIRQNSNDNKAIMMDLYNTYANLKIQMESGLYIADSIEYAHKSAQNERYKEALGELIINFSDKTVPMADAIAIFKNRFNSKEIDTLCALLNNCVMYGTQDAYTKDIMGEIQSIIKASTTAAEHDIETKAGLISFVFFGIIIFVTAYTVYNSFLGIGLFL